MSAVLNVTEIKGVKIVSFDGINRFNAIVSQSVKEQINLLLSEPGAKVIFNLVGVRFIDSSAFGALISNLKTAKLNGTIFKLCNITQEIKEIIVVMQLDTVFSIYESLDACMETLS